MKINKYELQDHLIKVDTGALYKIIKITWVETNKKKQPVNDWLYDCETLYGDQRNFVRYYETRLDKEFFQVPKDDETVQAILKRG